MKETAKEQKKKNSASNSKSRKSDQPAGSLFEILDTMLTRNFSWLIWLIVGLAALFSLLLFDQKVSLTGDDSFYIIRASEFINSFKYPSFQGPLYPMLLSIIVLVFGISLIPLKVFSLVAMVSFFFILFKILYKRIPATILVATLIVVSINSFLLYYSSQTYNEAFYLLVQALLLLVFFTRFIDTEKTDSLFIDIKRHLLLAVCLLTVTLTKNIGFSAIVAVVGYFLLRGQWKNLLYSIVAFGVVYIAFQGIRHIFWGESGLQFSTQGSGLLNKDYYNPQNGKEDFAGMIKRFTDNSQLYLSKHFLYMVGFRTYEVVMTVNPLSTIVIYILAFTGLILSYKKNAYIFFIGLLAGSFLFVTFIVLQAKWDQGRLIIPLLVFLILMIFSAMYYLAELRKLKLLQFVLPLFVAIVFFPTLAATTSQIKKSRQEVGRFGGLSPDWKHYLQASEWAAENLPPNAVIACRKPSISFVYGKGRNFYGIMQMPSFNLEQFYTIWKNNPASMVAYSYNDFSGKQLPAGMYELLKKNMIAQFFVGENFYFIDKFPDSLVERTLATISSLGITGITSAAQMREINLQISKPATVIYPDSLLDRLLTNKVSHVLTANLRRNSLEKNGQIINTVERYMSFIDDKYPGFLTKVTQIGSDDNEPASIIKLDYAKTGRKVNW